MCECAAAHVCRSLKARVPGSAYAAGYTRELAERRTQHVMTFALQPSLDPLQRQIVIASGVCRWAVPPSAGRDEEVFGELEVEGTSGSIY